MSLAKTKSLKESQGAEVTTDNVKLSNFYYEKIMI